MRTSISSALFAVVAALSTGLLVPPTSASPIDLTDSTPTVTHQEVARSFASGGSTCYCKPLPDIGSAYILVADPNTHLFAYPIACRYMPIDILG